MAIWSSLSLAVVFDLPKRGDDVVGKLLTYRTKAGDDFVSIATAFDVGYYNLIEANPGVDPKKTPKNTQLIIPNRHILPNAPRDDIVINLAEMRLYYFPLNERKVYVYPVGIGREETGTPLGYMRIIEKREKPVWHSPKSVREARAKDGVKIPKVVQPGPDNPLGDFALRLSHPTYLIHGTNNNSGVGRRSSAGCIRMFNADVRVLYEKVSRGTKVLVVNQPIKVGRLGDDLLVEAHLPLHEYDTASDLPKMKRIMYQALRGMVRKYRNQVDAQRMVCVAKAHQGIPQSIARAPVQLPEAGIIVRSSTSSQNLKLAAVQKDHVAQTSKVENGDAKSDQTKLRSQDILSKKAVLQLPMPG